MRATRIILALLAACGDDDQPVDAGPGDASTDAPIAIAPMPPQAPLAPELPRMTPCPTGWAEAQTPEGFTYCNAFPAGPRDCTGATMQRPGDTDCVPIGPPCPGGDYAEDLPTDRPVVFVKVGATMGDGTRDLPYGSLSEALPRAPDDAVIALARGRHPGGIGVRRSVELRGACAAETTITSETGNVITVQEGATLTASAMTVEALGARGIVIQDGIGSLVLEGVRVEPGSEGGIIAKGASFVARDVLVRNVDGIDGIALSGECDIDGLVIETDAAIAMRVATGSVRARRVTMRPAADEMLFSGATINGGGSLTLEEVAIVDARSPIYASGGATLNVDHAYVVVDPSTRFAADVRTTASIDSQATVTLSHFYGLRGPVFATGSSGITLSMTDVVLQGVREGENSYRRSGVIVVNEVEATLTRVATETGHGFMALGEPAHLVGRDLSVVDTLDLPGESSFAFGALEGGRFEIERARATRSALHGMLAFDGHIQGRDIDLEETGTADLAAFGVGATESGTITLERARVRRAGTAALAAFGAGSLIEGSDVSIVDPQPFGVGELGRGIDAESGARISLERVRVERAFSHAAIANAGGVVELREASLIDVSPQACATTFCASKAFGVGAGSYLASSLSLSRFEISGAALCGVHLGAEGQIDLAQGTIHESAIGVCVGDADYDVARLTNEVTFHENGSSLDSVALPVPEPLPGIEASSQ